MNDAEQHLRVALSDRLDNEALRPPPLPAASRKAIRRRRAALLLASSTVVAAGVLAVAALSDRTYGFVYDRDMGVIAPPRPQSGTTYERVWDGDVAFEISRLDCRHGSDGDEDGDGNPDGSRCTASLFVVNESAEEVLVPQSSHVLTAGGRRFPPSERGMNELVADFPGSPIRTPIPPGGAAALLLVFEYPSSLQPESLEVHSAEGSPGAVIALEQHCTWSRYRGRVSGGCFTTDHSVEVGVRYPDRISGPRGGMALYYVCFDERQWEVVEPHPTAVSVEGFAGQGYMTLESPRRAIFEDNSGAILRLVPTEDNEENPGVCG